MYQEPDYSWRNTLEDWKVIDKLQQGKLWLDIKKIILEEDGKTLDSCRNSGVSMQNKKVFKVNVYFLTKIFWNPKQ